MPRDGWGGSRAVKAKQWCIQHLGTTCWLCGKPITETRDYTVDHVIPRSQAPHLMWEPSNWRPAHGRRHPELNCPGNYSRQAQAPAPPRTSRNW